MTALCIIAGIVLFFILLSFVPVSAVMRFSDTGEETFSLSLRVLFIPIPLFPKKKKLPKLSNYKIGRLKCRGKKLAAKKNAKKTAPKKKGSAKKASAGDKSKKKRNVKHILKLVLAVTKKFLGKFGKYLRIDVKEFAFSAASKDPAETAVFYGAVYAAAELFFDTFGNRHALKHVKRSDLSFYADFGSEKPHVRGKITFTLLVGQIFSMAFSSGMTALCVHRQNRKNETPEERAEREKREEKAREALVKELRSF